MAEKLAADLHLPSPSPRTRFRRKLFRILICVLAAGLLAAISTVAFALATGWRIQDGTAELPFLDSSQLDVHYQDTIPFYRSESGEELLLYWGWLWCSDSGSTLPYVRFLEVRTDKAEKVEKQTKIPVDAIDVDPKGTTQCAETTLAMIGAKKWCPDEWTGFCLWLPTLRMVPFGQRQNLLLSQAGAQPVLTVNAALWQVYSGYHPVSEPGHFALEQAARVVDFYGIEDDPIKIIIDNTVDRIWGQCGIQFRLQARWGRNPLIDSSKYQVEVAEELSHPGGIADLHSMEFMNAVLGKALFSGAINLYLFPVPLGQSGACRIRGAAYARDSWDAAPDCPQGNEYCGSGDVFLTNVIDCLDLVGSREWAYQILARTIAHETGHILLGTAGHAPCEVEYGNNLMESQEDCPSIPGGGQGINLTREQCETARSNLTTRPLLQALLAGQ